MNWDIKWIFLCQYWNYIEYKIEIQCWKLVKSLFNGKICISLNVDHLEIWIITWLDKIVIQFISSSILEFWQLKTFKMLDNHHKKKTISTTSKLNQIITSITSIIINLDKFILETKNNLIKSQAVNSISIKHYIHTHSNMHLISSKPSW